MDNTHKENNAMKIAVPDNIAAAALGGDTSVLGEVADAYAALKDAQSRAQAALLPDIAQVLADGLARPKATNGENAQMVITEDGQMVVMLGDHEEPSEPEAPAAAPVPTPAPAPAPKSGKTPSIGELRSRAEAAGVDISDLDGRNQKDEMLARIEAAENAPAPSEPEEEPLTEPDEEIAAESKDEEPVSEPVSEAEDDGLGLSDDPDDEPVESPENEEGVPPVEPPSDEELDVDDWLE